MFGDYVGHGLEGEAEDEAGVEDALGHDVAFPGVVVVVVECFSSGFWEVGKSCGLIEVSVLDGASVVRIGVLTRMRYRSP